MRIRNSELKNYKHQLSYDLYENRIVDLLYLHLNLPKELVIY